MEQTITITKRYAARKEIEGATRLLADHHNYVGAELLASAAIDVIKGVASEHGFITLAAVRRPREN